MQVWREADGRHGRKKFKTCGDPEAFMATKNVELANTDSTLRSIVTWLFKAHVEEAEATFT
ncbi:MAG: hypothetical protein WCI46_02765 [Verrucomicrobiota bacterium]